MKNSPLTCPFCKTELEPDATACEVCGRSLSDAIGAPPGEEKPAANLLQQIPTLLTGRIASDTPEKPASEAPQAPVFGALSADGGQATPRQIAILVGAVIFVACLLVFGGATLVQFVGSYMNEQSASASQTADALAREFKRTEVSAELTQTWEAYAVRTTEEAQSTETAYTSQVLLSEGRSWPVILEDNFEVDTGAWYIEEGEDDLSVFLYRVQDGVYAVEMTAKRGMSQWLWPDVMDVSLDTFYLAADMQMSGPDSMDGGLIFHLGGEDDRDFYLFDITRTGEYGVYVHITDEWNLLTDYLYSDVILPDGANRIEIIARPSEDGTLREFSFFINGAWMATMQDSSLEGGWIGLQVGLTEEGDQGLWTFDNFILRMP